MVEAEEGVEEERGAARGGGGGGGAPRAAGGGEGDEVGGGGGEVVEDREEESLWEVRPIAAVEIAGGRRARVRVWWKLVVVGVDLDFLLLLGSISMFDLLAARSFSHSRG